MLSEIVTEPARPIASVHANVPEGLLFMSNTSDSHKQTIAQFAVIPLFVVAAGAAAGYRSTLDRVRERAAEAEREAPPRIEPDGEGDAAPARAVKNNLQQIAFSAQTYFIDNPKAKEVTYEELVKAELIFDLDPVAGESYKGLTLKRAGGEISVKTKAGDAITHKYQASSE
jgi:hypothetical protein